MNKTNYCTEYIEETTDSEQSDNPSVFQNLLAVQGAVKFRMPENGMIADVIEGDNVSADKMDELVEYLRRNPLILPYAAIGLEFKLGMAGVIVVAAHNLDIDCIEFKLIIKNVVGGVNHWFESMVSGVIMADFSIGLSKPDDMEVTPEEIEMIVYCAYAIMGFMAAVQCSNVHIIDDVSDDKLNKSRIKKGKTPFCSYKLLAIDSANNLNGQSKTEKHLKLGSIELMADKTVWNNKLSESTKK